MSRTLIVVAGVAALALCACGKQGELERPAPLSGAAADRDATTRRVLTPQENYDPASSNRSIAASPIQGTSDPIGPPPSLTAP